MSGCSDIVNMSIVDIVKCLVLTKIVSIHMKFVSIHMKFTSTNQLILSLAKKLSREPFVYMDSCLNFSSGFDVG